MKKTAIATIALVGMLALSGCTGSPELEVTTAAPAASETPSATPTQTPSADAERGTRANPLAVGETRQLVEGSIWILGADGATQVNDGYVVLPLHIGFDWAAARLQEGGQNVDNDGIDPFTFLTVEFVSADGRSHTTFDDYSVTIPNQLYDVGTVYPPTEALSVNVPISVPADQVPGGTWVISNYRGDKLFIAQS